MVSNDEERQGIEGKPSGTQNAPLTNKEELVRIVETENNVRTTEGDKGEDAFHVSKRTKTSEALGDYKEFEENGTHHAICLHCTKKISRGKTKQTTSKWRHRNTCSARKAKLRQVNQQTKINFQP